MTRSRTPRKGHPRGQSGMPSFSSESCRRSRFVGRAPEAESPARSIFRRAASASRRSADSGGLRVQERGGLGVAAPFRETRDLDRVLREAAPYGERVSLLHFLGRFRARAVQSDVATVHRRLGLRSRTEEPRRPEPTVDAGAVHYGGAISSKWSNAGKPRSARRGLRESGRVTHIRWRMPAPRAACRTAGLSSISRVRSGSCTSRSAKAGQNAGLPLAFRNRARRSRRPVVAADPSCRP